MFHLLATLGVFHQSQDLQVSFYLILDVGEAGVLFSALGLQLPLLLMSLPVEFAHRLG